MTRRLQADDMFPMVAQKEQDLKTVNNLLHDLSLDLPDYDYQPQNGVVALTLTDQEMIVKPNWVSEFCLSVFDVTEYKLEEDSKDTPTPVNFNKIKFGRSSNEVVAYCEPGVRLRFRVGSLHIEVAHVP